MKSDHINSSQPNTNNPETSKVYEIPVEGSLALLALGAVGLKAWREKKKSVNNDKNLDSNTNE